jgi:hypothetical protein
MVFFSDSIEKAFRKHSAAAEKSPSKSVKGAVLIACGILLNFLQRAVEQVCSAVSIFFFSARVRSPKRPAVIRGNSGDAKKCELPGSD